MSFTQFVTLISAASAGQDFYWINLAGSSDGLAGSMAGGLADGQAAATAWMPNDTTDGYTIHFDNQGSIVASRRNTTLSSPQNNSPAAFDDANSRLIAGGEIFATDQENGVCSISIDGDTQVFSDSISDSGNDYQLEGLHVDASGNVYAFGARDADPSFFRRRLDYWNSSGTYQGGYRGNPDGPSRCYGGTTDASGNIYLLSYGQDTISGSAYNLIEVMKLNSSFVKQWGTRLYHTDGTMPDAVTSGNVSVTSDGGTVNTTIKISNSAGGNGQTYTTQLNGSTGVYVSSYYTGTTSPDTYFPNTQNHTGDGWVYTIDNNTSVAVVNILNSSLAAQGRYQIEWTGAASSGNYIVGVSGAPNDAIYITGLVKGLPSSTETDWKMFTIKLPKDGSVTGTFSVGSEEVEIGYISGYRSAAQIHNATTDASWDDNNSTDAGTFNFGVFATSNFTESTAVIP